MDLSILIAAVGLAIAIARLILAYLVWRHPRAASPSPSAEDQRKDQEEKDEGLALFLGLLWAARSRRKAMQEPADSN